MTPLLSLILLLLIAYVGAVFLHSIKTPSLVFKGITNSGIIYLFLGYIIGPNILKILNSNVLNELSLILAFVLGWAGFIIGLQINAKQMLRFPAVYYWKTILFFGTCFLMLVGIMGILNFFVIKKLSPTEIVLITVAGSISSPLLIGLLKTDYKFKGKLIHFLQFNSAYDNMIGIVIVGLMLFINQEINNNSFILIKDAIIIFVGASVMAFLFYFIAKSVKTVPQYFLLIIGFLLILVGTAMYLEQSVIFVSFIFGTVLANLPINTWKLFQTISNTEKPLFLILLIFVGARLNILMIDFIYVAAIFIFFRIISKYISGLMIVPKFQELKKHTRLISFSGIGMGGVSLALGLDYLLLNNYAAGEGVLLIIALAYVLNDTFSLKLIDQIIK